MPRHKTPAPQSETGVKDFHQEITAIIQEASRERWVIEEARLIEEARADKEAWTSGLYRGVSRRKVTV